MGFNSAFKGLINWKLQQAGESLKVLSFYTSRILKNTNYEAEVIIRNFISWSDDGFSIQLQDDEHF
jgi:hypothetical protein